MKHHFVKTDNYRNLIDGVAYMESRGSLTTCLCLVHGDPGVGKTRNISRWGPDAPAIFIKGHVGMNLDGLIWSVSQGLGIKHLGNRTAEIDAQIRGLRDEGQRLIFDEAQFGLAMKHAGKPGAGIEYLRDLCERGGMLLLAGCQTAPGKPTPAEVAAQVCPPLEATILVLRNSPAISAESQAAIASGEPLVKALCAPGAIADATGLLDVVDRMIPVLTTAVATSDFPDQDKNNILLDIALIKIALGSVRSHVD